MNPQPARQRQLDSAQLLIIGVAAIFAAVWTLASYVRWANFAYRTFDLAYYVQAVWQLIHGRFAVTVENVPLLGNHVEPIVFLFAPLFALVRNPMLFVAIQNAALASMGPIGYKIARRFGFATRDAALLTTALLLAPATSYVALHEFHPEALTAPLLLLMLYARSASKLWLHWLGFMAVLSCKENMALLLGAYCLVFLIVERKMSLAQLFRWYGGPLVLAVFWFVLCTKVISPAFNSGNIDYLALYDRLGNSGGEIFWNMIARPQLFGQALAQSLMQGNLLWALLLPFLGLPLLRPRWILISVPILLQHLLSWRSSEWSIFFHYAAPLIPLFWFGAVEAISRIRDRAKTSIAGAPLLAISMVAACLVGQTFLGPVGALAAEFRNWSEQATERARKEAMLREIPSSASVVAPLPYLSHLAMRERLYSLHYILKGLKTLSRERYEPPPPPDIVLVDYNDSATFDPGSGYYHPQMRTSDGRIMPSSDRLLHDFLSESTWKTESRDQITIYRKSAPNETSERPAASPDPDHATGEPVHFASAGLELRNIFLVHAQSRTPVSKANPVEIELEWAIQGERKVFPWMILRLSTPQKGMAASFTKGLCALEARQGTISERWRTGLSGLPPGKYTAEAFFVDQSKQAWSQAHGEFEGSLLARPVLIGDIRIGGPSTKDNGK